MSLFSRFERVIDRRTLAERREFFNKKQLSEENESGTVRKQQQPSKYVVQTEKNTRKKPRVRKSVVTVEVAEEIETPVVSEEPKIEQEEKVEIEEEEKLEQVEQVEEQKEEKVVEEEEEDENIIDEKLPEIEEEEEKAEEKQVEEEEEEEKENKR